MTFSLPHTIQSHLGHELTFLRTENVKGEERLILEMYVSPGARSILLTHHRADETLTVVYGKLGYQLQGEEPRTAGIGETVTVPRGTPRRFWNAGSEELHCYGSVTPAGNTIFYLTALFNALNESGTELPNNFDGAYLLYRYRRELALPGLPRFVQSVVIPATYTIGKLTGKYRKFQNAPAPI